LLSKNVPLPVVSKRLGHSNPNITLGIYAHAFEVDELAAAKVWDFAMAAVSQSAIQESPGFEESESSKIADS
jgi:hypothetical protein